MARKKTFQHRVELTAEVLAEIAECIEISERHGYPWPPGPPGSGAINWAGCESSTRDDSPRWWSCRGCLRTFRSQGWTADLHGAGRGCQHRDYHYYVRDPVHLGRIVEE